MGPQVSAPRLALQCAPFPNTYIMASARRIGTGALAGAYRGTVRTIEHNAWSTPCVNAWRCDLTRASAADAMRDATQAALEAQRTGYVPAGFTITESAR